MSDQASDDSRAWFAKAEQDWRMAELAFNATERLPEQCCYHSQQCAEKYLKGYLRSRNEIFRRSHDLEYLIDLCALSNPEFMSLNDDAEVLTRLAEPSRYPSANEIPIGPSEADQAMNIAGRIRSVVLANTKA